jgi:hypothetical protein
MDLLPRSTRRNLLQTLDGPCSALALNCCQFSCCIPRDALSDYHDDDHDHNHDDLPPSLADWMKHLLSNCPTLKLRDLVIPGTHDSGSYSIPATTLFSAVGRTQNESVLEQLQRGARYLDVRVGGATNSSSHREDSLIWHGCLAGGTFQLVVDQIATFLHHHDGEFVIVEVVAEYGRPFTPTQKMQCLKVLQETLGDMVYTSPTNLNTLFHQSNLADVIHQQKKQCLVLLHGRFYDGLADATICESSITYNEEYIESHFGFFRSDRWMNNRWYNTRDVTQLLKWNLEQVQQHGDVVVVVNDDKSRLLQNQVVLTPGAGSPTDVLRLLVGQLSLRPVSLALRLYQVHRCEDFFRQYAQQQWNMITLDFIDLVPGLVAFLINLNYHPPLMDAKRTAASAAPSANTPIQLQISLAAVHDGTQGSSTNVTDKVRALIQRDCVLYVTDVARDLGLSFATGQLTLVYRVCCITTVTSGSGTLWQVKQIYFDAYTQILVGAFVQSQGQVVTIDIESNKEGGVIFQGKRQDCDVPTPTNCCVIQYHVSESNEPEFSLLN